MSRINFFRIIEKFNRYEKNQQVYDSVRSKLLDTLRYSPSHAGNTRVTTAILTQLRELYKF